jgi:hypothetical protein
MLRFKLPDFIKPHNSQCLPRRSQNSGLETQPQAHQPQYVDAYTTYPHAQLPLYLLNLVEQKTKRFSSNKKD